MKPLRILIDLQGAQNNSRHRGIGRYSLALVNGIARQAGNHRVFLLLNGLFPESILEIQESLSGILPQNRFLLFSSPGPVSHLNPENAWRRCTAELLREHVIETLSPDVLLITSLVEGAEDDSITSIGRLSQRTVASTAIIYDLIPLIDPETHIPSQPLSSWYNNKIESLLRADYLFAISSSTLNDAVRLLKVSENRIVNISSAVDGKFAATRASMMHAAIVTRRFGIVRPYLMLSSAFERRKNFQGLVKAFAALPANVRAKHQLVLVCKLGSATREELTRLARSVGLGPREMVLTGFLPDEDLIALYSTCHLFVFPSFLEGFGLPALEAMCCGAPTIGSNLTSVPEVIGRQDALFDPSSTEQMTSLILRALTDSAFYASLKSHATLQAARFSWDATAIRAIAGMWEAFVRRGSCSESEMGAASRRKRLIAALAAVAKEYQPSDLEILELARSIELNDSAVRVMRASAAFTSP